MLSSISKPIAAGAAIGVLAVLIGFAPARAVPVAVTYSINLTFFSPAAGTNVLQGPGSLTVEFANGTAGGHVSAGSLHVVSGTAMLTNNFAIVILGNPVTFTGAQLNTFASGMGNVTAGGLFNLTTVGHIASGMIHCAGALCGFAGFTASVPQNLTSGPRTVNIINGALAGFPSLGPQTFAAAGTGGPTPQGGVLQLTATGQEVGRVVVPEPGTGLLLGLGLAGFGIALTSWRARQRHG